MKRLTFIITCILLTTQLNAQEAIRASLYQDARLAVLGSNEYDAFTTDVLAKIRLEGNQQKWGFMSVNLSYEIADIESTYQRYYVGVGYTLNQLFVRNLEFSAELNYGIINRGGFSWLAFGTDFETAYKLNDTWKISLVYQVNERPDVEQFWGKSLIRGSFFVGVTCKIFKPRFRG